MTPHAHTHPSEPPTTGHCYLVTVTGTPTSPEDSGVPGAYFTTVRVAVPANHRAAAALDVFHSHVAVGNLDDFKFQVTEVDGVEVVDDGTSEPYQYAKSGSLIGKRSDAEMSEPPATESPAPDTSTRARIVEALESLLAGEAAGKCMMDDDMLDHAATVCAAFPAEVLAMVRAADPAAITGESYVLEGEDWAQRYDDDEDDNLTDDERADFVRRLGDAIGRTLDEISDLTWRIGSEIRGEILAERPDDGEETPPVTTAEKLERLQALGWICGPRDPNLNRTFPGVFMAAEPYDIGTVTYDGSNGPWCIVGDDLDSLVHDAFDFATSG